MKYSLGNATNSTVDRAGRVEALAWLDLRKGWERRLRELERPPTSVPVRI